MYTNWALSPIADPAIGYHPWNERPSVPLVRELLRRHADLPDYGTHHFSGTRSEKNALWKEYRNYLYQALTYFDAALNVPDRSACLLLYYSLLNFAKAELLSTHATDIVGKRIVHGLSYNPTKAKRLSSDVVTVQAKGVFPLLYEKRVGKAIQADQILRIPSLLSNILEISTQLTDTGLTKPAASAVFQMVAMDQNSSWPTLLNFSDIDPGGSTGRLFYKVFRQVGRQATWRDHFGFSRRTYGEPKIYESIRTAGNPSGQFNFKGAVAITWALKEILSPPTYAEADAFITPSLYRSRMLPMPACLARYAVIFYASSLVRYRPSFFDLQLYPENRYLFDAIARECALPILVDTLNGLEDKLQIFYAQDALRL
jgi:hypothetical protein